VDLVQDGASALDHVGNRQMMAGYWLICLSLPLAVAGQYLALLLTLGLALWLGRKGDSCSWTEAWQLTSFHWQMAGLFLGLRLVSGWINSEQLYEQAVVPIWGFLAWFVGPVSLVKVFKSSWQQRRRQVISVICTVIFLWGLLALSQILWPWKLSSSGIVPDVGRARGWYSHPLTLAYASLWLVPWSIIAAIKRSEFPGWLRLGVGTLLLVLCSMSRTVQLVSAAVFVIAAVRFVPRRQLALVFCGAALGVSLLLITDNPVSRRLHQSIHGQIDERGSGYPDDRLAFWHAHWLMFLDKPQLGHGGAKVGKAERIPYYERIGLRDFKKPYEAHNELLQILVEQGVIGLSVWLLWLTQLLRYIWRNWCGLERFGWMTTVGAMLVAGLSQNWFHDSEVRFGLMLVIVVLVLENGRPRSRPAATSVH
jgi:O-Antigen ligase